MCYRTLRLLVAVAELLPDEGALLVAVPDVLRLAPEVPEVVLRLVLLLELLPTEEWLLPEVL